MSLEHLSEFKSDLLQLELSAVYDKYIACEECRGALDFDADRVRSVLATKFDVQKASVRFVGSAKIGFTVVNKSKTKTPAGRNSDNDAELVTRPRYSVFDKNSDIDIAIVSKTLFDSVWKDCFTFYTSVQFDDGITWKTGRKFRDYFFRGWIRPDKLPAGRAFPFSDQWFEYFREQTNQGLAGDYKIRAGVFREEEFLKHYQLIGLGQCANEIRAGL